jgi:hypothetical protein
MYFPSKIRVLLVWFKIISQHGNLCEKLLYWMAKQKKKAPWPESAGELYRQSDRHLSAK